LRPRFAFRLTSRLQGTLRHKEIPGRVCMRSASGAAGPCTSAGYADPRRRRGAERNIPLTGTGITIRIDDGQPADATALRNAITSAPAQAWTGVEVTVTGEHDFWLAGQDGFFRPLAGTEAAQRSGLVSPAFN